jgi:hypothetical protein
MRVMVENTTGLGSTPIEIRFDTRNSHANDCRARRPSAVGFSKNMLNHIGEATFQLILTTAPQLAMSVE